MPPTATLEITINLSTKAWTMACDIDHPGQRDAVIMIAIELLQNYLATEGKLHADLTA